MINFSTRYINTVSFIISVIILFVLNNYNFFIQKIDSGENFVSNQYQAKIEQENTSIKDITKEDEVKATDQIDKNKQRQNGENNQQKNNQKTKGVDWQIEIPVINLKAQISEGTSKEVMDTFVGHFEETTKDIGNIGLAAHNRGYKVNYFQELKKLKEGDEIIYKYNDVQRKYKVKLHKIIKDTDWDLLENTEENKITLITCVENEPEYRRCVQAVEI